MNPNFYQPQKPLPSSPYGGRRAQVVGHRGAAGLAPQNTLSAVQVALDLKLDGIEIDVQRSADGQLVIFHDPEVDHLTNGRGPVRDLALADLQKLDAGSAFDPRFAGEKIPTLIALFDLVQGADLLLFLEIKDPHHFPGIAAQIAALIRQYHLEEQVQVRSFFHPILHEFYKIAPEIALSELWYEKLPQPHETFFLTVDALYSLYDAAAITTLHQRGQKATAWTVNDPILAQQLIGWGVDSLTTDYPDRLLPLVGAK